MKKEIEGFEFIDVSLDDETGARFFIAVHSNALGPALGGIRMFHYKTNSYGVSPKKAAEKDALRLARAMTFKASVAGLELGGGKSVILVDPATLDLSQRALLFERFGKVINQLCGKYIAAEDVGTNETDMLNVRKQTDFVTGVPGEAGNPSPVTAFGVFRGMQACTLHAFGSESLKGRTVAVQGIGNVGFSLLHYLDNAGANIIVSDIDSDKLAIAKIRFNARSVDPKDIVGVDCDIFAPCAFGEVINKNSINDLKCRIIAGAANNQLALPKMGVVLHEKGFVYAPDYVINCGGLISVANEAVVTGSAYNKSEVMQKTDATFDRILNVLKCSEMKNVATTKIADSIAMKRIEKNGR